MMPYHDDAISAVLLFGSLARDDHARGSDTDLLLVGPWAAPHHKSIGHLSMFFYPWTKLLADADRGDLFACHIVRESKPVFDPSGQLEELQRRFRLRPSYRTEINQAADLGWFLLSHASELAPRIAARRMIWCVRTILIAKTAERGTPLFSPAHLAATASSKAAIDLLVERHQRRPDAVMRQRLHQFLMEEVGPPITIGDDSIADWKERFELTGNQVALQTIERGLDEVLDLDPIYA